MEGVAQGGSLTPSTRQRRQIANAFVRHNQSPECSTRLAGATGHTISAEHGSRLYLLQKLNARLR